ncbi:MAG: GlxA family transcriptional regulator [Hyphomicrobiales bacterium]|nr:GlxA family transcriptional regulator [Hyphomicrobiales bacterium]
MGHHGSSRQTILFLLVPKFSMIAFSSAIEALRLANRAVGKTVYEWRLVSEGGLPVEASNGVLINTDASLRQILHAPETERRADFVILCSGIEVENFNNPKIFAWLRRMHGRNVSIGGLCTGAWILAKAGLLEDRRCAIHWEMIPSFAETFPDVDVRQSLFEVDSDIFTCAGGTVALDMMLYFIGLRFGTNLAERICDICLTDRIRPAHDRQRLPIGSRLGVQNPRLLSIIEIMEANIAEPISLEEIAHVTSISRRHIERLFRHHLERSPARYYLEVRLERARRLLRHSNLPIIEVAIASGFMSASHFSKRYREYYKVAPHIDRHRPDLEDGVVATGQIQDNPEQHPPTE